MSEPAPEIAYLESAEGHSLAFRLRRGRAPTLLFLPGYASDMEGTKALALDGLAGQLGLSMLRFDYSGTGSSGGSFEEATLERWIGEALLLADRLTHGPLILVGSSMGGWIALHVTLARPDRVAALAGIAAAPDFTDWGYSAEEKRRLVADGRLEQPNPYGPEPQVTSRAFWESGERLKLLDGELAIDCPVRLVHGDADDEVPVEVAIRLMRRLRSTDVQLLLVKDGGHRLSQPNEIAAIVHMVRELAAGGTS
jgi:pimeloyl-ACP methyl ester carboxylesterase